MILYSNSVQNVLDRLFLEDVAFSGKEPNTYNECIEALEGLENCIIGMTANKPLAWAREKTKFIPVGRYWFSYKVLPDAIVVDEVYDTLTGQIITEAIAQIKSLIERIERLNN